jgi:hypothetical protein
MARWDMITLAKRLSVGSSGATTSVITYTTVALTHGFYLTSSTRISNFTILLKTYFTALLQLGEPINFLPIGRHLRNFFFTSLNIKGLMSYISASEDRAFAAEILPYGIFSQSRFANSQTLLGHTSGGYGFSPFIMRAIAPGSSLSGYGSL